MHHSAIDIASHYALDVRVMENALTVDLSDRRTIAAPLGWFPRLEHGRLDERSNCRLINIIFH